MFVDRETLLSQEETTHSDPLAMAMYAITINPLMHRLEDEETKQVWFADDATAGGSLAVFKTWWNCIIDIGPEYGYHPIASNTWLILKRKKHLKKQQLCLKRQVLPSLQMGGGTWEQLLVLITC